MSSCSEEDSIDPDNPTLNYASLPLSERAAKLGALVSQEARSEPIRPPPMLRPALLTPKVIDEPARRTRDLNWRAAIRVTTVIVAVVALAALLFAIIKPAPHVSVASPTLSDITGSTSHSDQAGLEAPAAERTAPAALPPSQTANDEPSRQLLQRFLQWREKAIDTETSQ